MAVLAAVLGTSLLLGTGASGKPSAKAEIPAKVRPELLKIALHSAAKQGDRDPYDIQAVRAPDNIRFTPPKVPGREKWLYYIAMRGQFRGCPKRKGEKGGPNTYSALEARQKCNAVLEVTVLAANLEPLFRSESCTYPDLGSHGTPVRLGAIRNPTAGAPEAQPCPTSATGPEEIP